MDCARRQYEVTQILSSQRSWDDFALYRIFWRGRKFNQIDVHFVPSLCKLWHKSYIANRTSFHSFSWCMKLTCANAHSAATKNSKLAKGRILTRNTINHNHRRSRWFALPLQGAFTCCAPCAHWKSTTCTTFSTDAKAPLYFFLLICLFSSEWVYIFF